MTRGGRDFSSGLHGETHIHWAVRLYVLVLVPCGKQAGHHEAQKFMINFSKGRQHISAQHILLGFNRFKQAWNKVSFRPGLDL